MDFLDDLNPPQRAAVTHGAGPLLILAGAGSGKTRVLAYRIAYLLRKGGVSRSITLVAESSASTGSGSGSTGRL